MSVTTLPDLDQQTAEDLRPACDIRETILPGGVRALTWGPDSPGTPCDQPAVWIAHSTCPVCGAGATLLICDGHRARCLGMNWLCDCRQPFPFCRVTWERL